MDNYCRLCATFTNNNDLIDILTPKSELKEKIRKCLQLEVSSDDSFPKLICAECERQVTLFHAFKERVRVAQDVFKSDIQLVVKEETVEQLDQSPFPDFVEKYEHDDLSDYFQIDSPVSENALQADDSEDQDDVFDFSCQLCGFVCKDALKLKNHEYCCSKKRLFKCSVCLRLIKGTYFTQHLKTKKHKKTKKPFQCVSCDECFARRIEVVKHEREAHDENYVPKRNRTRAIMCHICGKLFSNAGSWQRHQMIHLPQKPYKCDFCDKVFSARNSMIEHRRTHTGERPYVCEICNMTFIRRFRLKRHHLTHTNVRRFQCEFCHKGFKQLTNLTQHKRIHTGEKPFECEHCGKLFSDKSAMTRHARIHTGEKPYECDVCGKCFNQNSSLKTHKRTHNKELLNF